MKTIICMSIIAIAATLQAQSLRFSSGIVSIYNDVTLTLQGPTNQTCRVERLDRTNQVWDSVGTVTLNASGTATFNTTLCEGMYGYYRTKTTNGNYYSTNAFGAVAGYLNSGYSMIGNPFGAQDISVIIPEPVDGTLVYRWNNVWQTSGTNTYVPLRLTEGFWINKPTNATWNVSVPIW